MMAQAGQAVQFSEARSSREPYTCQKGFARAKLLNRKPLLAAHCQIQTVLHAEPAHARMQSPRAPPAAHATLCKVVVRKPADF